MDKNYLEALKRMEYFVNEEMGIKTFKQSGWHIEGTDDYELVKEGLQRLVVIDNSNSNEALEIIRKCESSNYLNTWYPKFVEDLKTIENYILKSQEQEKVLKIMFEKQVDMFNLEVAIDNDSLELYNNSIPEKFKNSRLTQEEFKLIKRWKECLKNLKY